MSAGTSTILRSQNLGFESRHPANIVKHQQTAAAAATTASAAAESRVRITAPCKYCKASTATAAAAATTASAAAATKNRKGQQHQKN